MNAKMPELKSCFESAGFTEVRTVLSSGNVVFTARAVAPGSLERRAEEAMRSSLGRSFGTIVRSTEFLRSMIETDPFAGFNFPSEAKKVVTFLRHPVESALELPIERDGARILKLDDTEAFSVYVPSDKGPAFMYLLERTFGKDITTRTLDTVKKCALA